MLQYYEDETSQKHKVLWDGEVTNCSCKHFEFLVILCKEVNIVPEAVSVWPPVWYISDIGQYRYTVFGLPLFYIFYIYIYTQKKKKKKKRENS